MSALTSPILGVLATVEYIDGIYIGLPSSIYLKIHLNVYYLLNIWQSYGSIRSRTYREATQGEVPWLRRAQIAYQLTFETIMSSAILSTPSTFPGQVKIKSNISLFS